MECRFLGTESPQQAPFVTALFHSYSMVTQAESQHFLEIWCFLRLLSGQQLFVDFDYFIGRSKDQFPSLSLVLLGQHENFEFHSMIIFKEDFEEASLFNCPNFSTDGPSSCMT